MWDVWGRSNPKAKWAKASCGDSFYRALLFAYRVRDHPRVLD
jgi:hypothetical protein